MNTKESCKYDQAFFIKKIISVQKTNIPEEPNNTVNTASVILRLFRVDQPACWTGEIPSTIFK